MSKFRKFRPFAFTEFNLDNLKAYKEDVAPHCTYIILGNEECPETHRKHFQGFLIWKSPKTWSATKKILPEGVHIEQAKASALQNINYCKKENNLALEVGKRPMGQGSRSDFQRVRHLVDGGASMNEIISVATSYQSVRSAEIIRRYLVARREIIPVEVIWLWGSSGVGKTRFCFENYPDLYRVDDHKWWCGYDDHETILIDDIRHTTFPYMKLLKVLDIYPFQVEFKGGFTSVQYKRVLITCPFPPHMEYFSENRDCEELLRRISKIKYMPNL